MTAFVLGNGVSRALVSVDQLLVHGPVYGCNALYRSHTVTVLVATDRGISEDIQRSGYALKNIFYTRRPVPDMGARAIPKDYFGCSSGPVAAALAALEGHSRIYLLGFDLGGTKTGRFNNIYADTEHYKKSQDPPTYAGNWSRQLQRVCRDFPQTLFTRVFGDTTTAVPELQNLRNLQDIQITDFIERINNAKDL